MLSAHVWLIIAAVVGILIVLLAQYHWDRLQASWSQGWWQTNTPSARAAGLNLVPVTDLTASYMETRHPGSVRASRVDYTRVLQSFVRLAHALQHDAVHRMHDSALAQIIERTKRGPLLGAEIPEKAELLRHVWCATAAGYNGAVWPFSLLHGRRARANSRPKIQKRADAALVRAIELWIAVSSEWENETRLRERAEALYEDQPRVDLARPRRSTPCRTRGIKLQHFTEPLWETRKLFRKMLQE